LFIVNIDNAQLGVIGQSFHEIIFCVSSIVIFRWILSLQSLVNLYSIDLLALGQLEKSAHIAHDTGQLFLQVVLVSSSLGSSSSCSIALVTDLLQSSEAEIHEFDCLINIQLLDSVSEIKFRHGLRDSDDGQKSSWSDVGI